MAEEIFVEQIGVEFEATVDQDITGATELLIKYIKPSGKTGQWTATEVEASTGIMNFITTLATDIPPSEYGNWTFWGYVTFSDGGKMAGVPFVKRIFKEGEIC